MNTLLIGYYGKGNFGDDLLLKVTHRIVRERFPGSEVAVLCDTYREDYLGALLGERSRILRPGDREHFDLIVHGGGGTFFDYGDYGARDRMLDDLIHVVGFRAYAAIDRGVRAALNKQRLSADIRLGWGLGIGTYTHGSRRLRHSIPALLDFRQLVVRDATSLKNLKTLGLCNDAILGADLAFLDQYWVPQGLPVTSPVARPQGRPKLGLVLRDWPSGGSRGSAGYLDPIAAALPELSQRFDLSLFAFDRSTDPQVIALAAGYESHVWSPMTVGFDDYCRLLAQQDVMVTSRAHGAMCSAVLGVPSLIIELEAKLRTIHDILPNATRIVGPKASVVTDWHPLLDALVALDRDTVAGDVTRNKMLIASAVEQSLRHVH